MWEVSFCSQPCKILMSYNKRGPVPFVHWCFRRLWPPLQAGRASAVAGLRTFLGSCILWLPFQHPCKNLISKTHSQAPNQFLIPDALPPLPFGSSPSPNKGCDSWQQLPNIGSPSPHSPSPLLRALCKQKTVCEMHWGWLEPPSHCCSLQGAFAPCSWGHYIPGSLA